MYYSYVRIPAYRHIDPDITLHNTLAYWMLQLQNSQLLIFYDITS